MLASIISLPFVCRGSAAGLCGDLKGPVRRPSDYLQCAPITASEEVARHAGPLWGHSAFVFESGNGHLVRLVTGANAVPSQIVERVFLALQLDCFLASSLVVCRLV